MKTAPAVPRLWPGCTMVLLGDGPSLDLQDVNAVRVSGVRVLAMNTSFRLAPWADVLWSYHTRDLQQVSGVDPRTFGGLIFSAEPAPAPWPVLAMTGAEGLELDPTGVRHGNHSGYSAINVAVHLGAGRIILLGYDCSAAEDGRVNFARPADYAGRSAYRFEHWRKRYASLVGPLRTAGVEVLNASRRTAIDDFPRMPLWEALGPSFAAGARVASSPGGARVAAERSELIGGVA